MELSRAFVVPDLSSWLVWGEDVTGLQRVVAPERAELMLTPARLPSGLADAAREAWGRMPPSRRCVSRPSPLSGASIEEALADAVATHDDHAGHHEHHDHHDMMAVVGDPSADGLVMEAIDFELGPLSASLPGGLVVDLSLDGDVVASARPRATLHVGRDELASGAVPDALAPLSWRAALALDDTDRRRHVVAVEVERALSHAAWLQALGHALGWGRLADDALALARALLPARAASGALPPDALHAATARADDLRRLLGGRVARQRLRGLAPADADAVRSRGIGGPVARAAGVDDDARSADPLYSDLGFEPVVARAGDAEARTAVRAAELRASLDLAAAAAAREGGANGSGNPAVVEGPRGPLRATVDPAGTLRVAAPGAAGLLELAGEAVAGLELGAAIAGLVSFDLSPWRVGS